jgi:flagellar FliJ protein
MKKFRFSLETVLKVRRQNEEVKRRELALAQAERDQVLVALASQEASLRWLLEEESRERVGTIDLGRVGWFMARWGGVVRQIRFSKSELEKKEAALKLSRDKAVEASRERLVLEKLEEKQLQEHLFQLNREEQGLLDDLAQRAVSAFSPPSASTSAPGL